MNTNNEYKETIEFIKYDLETDKIIVEDMRKEAMRENQGYLSDISKKLSAIRCLFDAEETYKKGMEQYIDYLLLMKIRFSNKLRIEALKAFAEHLGITHNKLFLIDALID